MISPDTASPYTRTAACRISGSSRLVDLLDLGQQPLANSLKQAAEAPELRVPLTLSYAPESALVQLRETVPKETLFSSYVWVSGTAQATRDFARTFAESLAGLAGLQQGDLVLEIASNDGTFLKPFLERGYANVLGVDPAANIAAMANASGVVTIPAFWDVGLARGVVAERGRARAIIARNVIPHVSELADVMTGIALALDDEGVGAVEFHYSAEILDGLQYDSIYHEHLCYFSLASFSYLLRRFGLHPFHASFSPISGGALVVYFSKTPRARSEALRRIEADEVTSGINDLDVWRRFAAQCLDHRARSRDLVSGLQGRTVVGYGASARSSTYLNFCGFGRAEIAAMIDNNPLKQGRFTPGSALPIVPLEAGLALRPDYVFIFAWNFREEIMRSCRAAGYRGKFITALPNAPAVWE